LSELFRYAAFISYSSKDAPFARRLHRVLEGYGIPASLGTFDIIGGGKKNRIYPVFRDREELSAGQLGDQIEAHLKVSATLIVVCSPNGAASPWVQKEIEFFAALGRHARIFAIIPDTAPLTDESGADCTQSCFPPAFRGDALAGDKLEPLAADARAGKDGFRNAWLKLVAGMVGVTPGQIIDRDKQRQRARRRVQATTLCVALAGSVYLLSWIDARDWRRDLASYPEYVAAQSQTSDPAAAPVPVGALPFALGSLGQANLLFDAHGARAEALLTLHGSTRIARDLGDVYEVAMAADGSVIAARRPDGGVTMFRSDLARDIGEADLFSLSGDGRVLAILTRSGEVLLFDTAAESRPTLLTDAGPLQALALSDDGSGLLLSRRDGGGALYDLSANRLVQFGAVGELSANRGYWLSSNGDVAVLRPHRGQSVLVKVSDLSVTNLGFLGPAYDPGYAVSADGRVVVFRSQDGILSRFDVEPRELVAITPLGPALTWHLSNDGATLAVWERQGRGSFYDMATGASEDFGTWTSMTVTPDGRSVVAQSSDRRMSVRDFEGGARTLDALPDRTSGFVPNGGDAVFVQTRDNIITRFDLTGTGAVRELGFVGSLDQSQFSVDGAYLAAIRPDGSGALLDLRAPSPVISANGALLRGAALSRAICAASGKEVRPFSGSVRSGAADTATSQDLRVRDILRGRPWHACDWRGLLAIFPDATRGDGWFEGWRQWLRLLSVRYLKGRDWACEETTTMAPEDLRVRRREMCREDS